MINVKDMISELNIESRDYQIRIVEKTLHCFLEEKLKSVLIEAPTGSGKTVISMMIAKALHQELGLRIGWVAMRKFLLKQAMSENIDKGFNIPMRYLSMFSKRPMSEQYAVVGNVDKSGELDVLIVDEAQHDVTTSMSHLHGVLQPKMILMVTAVPWRTDKIKICADKIIKDAGIANLIQDGYLSPYHHYTIPKWTVEDVVNLYLSDKARWGKSLMYFHKVEQCFEAKRRLEAAGELCDVVYANSDIDRQLDLFDSNKLPLLINCMKLVEGFDQVDLKTVFCRPSGKPTTIQMAGRVLRKYKDLPYKQIVQSEDTPYPFQRTALAQLQYVKVEDDWRTLEVNKHISKIRMNTIKALSKITVKLPDMVAKAQQDRLRNMSPFRRRSNAESSTHAARRLNTSG